MKNIIITLAVVLLYNVSNSVNAQNNLTIRKTISANDLTESNNKVEHLVEWLVTNNKADVKYQTCESSKVILEGQLPVMLAEKQNELANQFNGSVTFTLEIEQKDDSINLEFKNLTHQSNNSVQGWDFDYGCLFDDSSAQLNPVYENYEYLSEFYKRLSRFESDKELVKRITKETVESIDHMLSLATTKK